MTEISTPFPVTPLFEANYCSTASTVVNQGGTNSGKTYSIMQVLCMKAIETPRTKILVTSDTFRALKTGAIRDLEDIRARTPYISDRIIDINKSDKIYTFSNGSFIEFSVFTNVYLAQKAGKRDFLFVNEPNRYPYEIFEQLWIRTVKQTYIDYNPRTTFWVHDKLIGEPKVQLIISNYSHNGYYDDNGDFISFVPESIVEKILLNKEKGYYPNGEVKDAHFANIWNVYGIGKTGQLMGVVYPNVKWVPDLPPKELWKSSCLGLDFGYNDEAALVRVVAALGKLWIKVLLYESGLVNETYCKRFEELGLKKGLSNGDLIICDSARPEVIKALRNKKWRCKKCKKGAGSVFAGITDILGHGELQMVSNSDLKEEQRNYVWKVDKITGKTLEEPIDDFNHIMDAMRYAKQGIRKQKRAPKVGYTK